MTNHPNRSRDGGSPSRNPSPEEIFSARKAAGLTQTAAGALVHTTCRVWQQWEAGARRMHPAFWELFLIKVRNSMPTTTTMDAPIYDIEVDTMNSADISDVCGSLGITHGRLIGGGYIEGREGQADAYVHFYAFRHPNGWEFRVATNAGDPDWEEADQAGFEELAASCGVNL